MQSETVSATTGKPLTGRGVLIWLAGFFGVMIVANGIFLYFAITTFSGLDDASSYRAGRNYSGELAAAAAQAERVCAAVRASRNIASSITAWIEAARSISKNPSRSPGAALVPSGSTSRPKLWPVIRSPWG